MRGVWGRVGLAIVTTWLLASPAPRAGGHRLTFRVQESFRIGSVVYPAGSLHVREVRELNPVSTIQEMWIDGDRIGFQIVRRGFSEAPLSVPTAVFSRRRGEPLVLLGYAVPGGDRATFYRVATDGGFASSEGAEDTVFVAAR